MFSVRFPVGMLRHSVFIQTDYSCALSHSGFAGAAMRRPVIPEICISKAYGIVFHIFIR